STTTCALSAPCAAALSSCSAGFPQPATATSAMVSSNPQAHRRACASVMVAAAALAAVDAERAQLLVQVRALDPERLCRARDVPVELRQPDPDELRLDLLAELAQALARVATQIDRRLRAGRPLLSRRARPAEVRRQ